MIEDIAGMCGTRLGPGTLYGAIPRLERQGWIEPLAAEERRQPYSITAQGLRVLRAKLTTLHLLADIVWSAFYERILPTRVGDIDGPNRSFGTVMKQPNAFLPLAMSVSALAMVLGYVARYGGGPCMMTEQSVTSGSYLWLFRCRS